MGLEGDPYESFLSTKTIYVGSIAHREGIFRRAVIEERCGPRTHGKGQALGREQFRPPGAIPRLPADPVPPPA
jgi:hypothetical protein